VGIRGLTAALEVGRSLRVAIWVVRGHKSFVSISMHSKAQRRAAWIFTCGCILFIDIYTPATTLWPQHMAHPMTVVIAMIARRQSSCGGRCMDPGLQCLLDCLLIILALFFIAHSEFGS